MGSTWVLLASQLTMRFWQRAKNDHPSHRLAPPTTHRRVWALAAPMILSNISAPLVALVDSTVIGHLPHAHQLGAVAVGASLYTFPPGPWAFAHGLHGLRRPGRRAWRWRGVATDSVAGLLLALGLAMLLGTLGMPLSHLALA
jgi:MATE family multidrug resistance protein